MRAKLILPALAAGLIVLAGCDIEDMGGSFERYHEDFHYNYPLKAGGRLAVDSFNGSVEVSVWDQETVDISGTKYARTQEETADLKIEVDHSADSVTVRAVRPSMRRGNYGAKFAIKVPRGVVLDHLTTSNGAIRTDDGVGPARLKTSNGHVEVRRLKGTLSAETSNGPVELQDIDGAAEVHTSNGHIRAEGVRGALDATTSNSSIHAVLERVDGSVRVQSSNGGIDLTMPPGAQSAVRAHTSNSGITLHLPGEVNARLSAGTSNGSISSDFEMRMRGEISKHHLEGTLGNGGPLIDLSTSNGPIRILK
jgi:Putative adhesin